jgi:hypothetical protein
LNGVILHEVEENPPESHLFGLKTHEVAKDIFKRRLDSLHTVVTAHGEMSLQRQQRWLSSSSGQKNSTLFFVCHGACLALFGETVKGNGYG